MTAEKTVIERADEIVGINWRKLGISPCHDTKNTYRRGAYLGWLASKEEGKCCDEFHKRHASKYRIGEVPIETMAEVVVAVHAATQPKGDGLPEVLIYMPNVAGRESVTIVKTIDGKATSMSLDEQCALDAYLTRCLSAPVRRLMAAFDVTEEADRKPGSVVLLRKPDGSANFTTTDKWIDEETICRLVPKVVKR